jgi:hypothetical protein
MIGSMIVAFHWFVSHITVLFLLNELSFHSFVRQPIPEPEKEVAFFCRPCIASCPVLRHASLQYVADKTSTIGTAEVESTSAGDASTESNTVHVESNKPDVVIPKASVCICKNIASLLEIPASDLFLRSDCDQLLCKCAECSAIYKSYSMDFLFEVEDEKTKRRNEVMFVSQQDDDLNASAVVDAVGNEESEAALMFDGMHKAGLDAHQVQFFFNSHNSIRNLVLISILRVESWHRVCQRSLRQSRRDCELQCSKGIRKSLKRSSMNSKSVCLFLDS